MFVSCDILDLRRGDLAAWLQDMGQPAYRADQVWQWLWAKGARDFSAMTNLSKDLRQALAERAEITWPEIAAAARSQDRTVKFLLRLSDGALVETVLIPAKDHYTQCLSTQVGCAMGCTFCATGTLGFTRNMSVAEIAGQVLVARQWLADNAVTLPLRNFVLMGMGEPLLNLDNVMHSLETMTSEQGLNLSPRRITLSTVGLAKGMDRVGESGLCSLAISLHAPTQELRERIMPKAAQLKLDELMALVDEYPLKQRQRVTIEYLLLGGVNDRPEHARQLCKLLAGKRVKINLIAYNPPKDQLAPYDPPSIEAVSEFQEILRDKDFTAMLRKSMGADIGAACGQLAADKA